MNLIEEKVVVLQVGKVPPPIGGVTIHVRRLLDALTDSYKPDISLKFYDLNRFSLVGFTRSIMRGTVVHVHTSSPLFRFLSVLLVRILKRKIVLTIHGDLGRFGLVNNSLDVLAVRFAHAPVVLNQSSLMRARRVNKNAVRMSAFLPGHSNNDLYDQDNERLKALRKSCRVFVTNAYAFSRDINGDEIYGILPLVSLFEKLAGSALVISDPSGQYQAYFKRNKFTLPENVLLLSYPHNFNVVLDSAHGFIRNTTTDGDSLSVHEALFKGIVVFCSDCGQRPSGATVYRSLEELDAFLRERGEITNNVTERYRKPETARDLVKLYKFLANGI